MKKLILLLAVLFSISSVKAQKKIDISDIFLRAVESESDTIIFSDYTVTVKSNEGKELWEQSCNFCEDFVKDKVISKKVSKDSLGRIIIKPFLLFNNTVFSENLIIKNLVFSNGIKFVNSELKKGFKVESCKINYFNYLNSVDFIDVTKMNLELYQSKIGILQINEQTKHKIGNVDIINCELSILRLFISNAEKFFFSSNNFTSGQSFDLNSHPEFPLEPSKEKKERHKKELKKNGFLTFPNYWITGSLVFIEELQEATIGNNIIDSKFNYSTYFMFTCDKLEFYNNKIGNNFSFGITEIRKRVRFKDNNFKILDLTNTILPELASQNVLYWDNIKGRKLSYLRNGGLYNPHNSLAYLNFDDFEKLIATYQTLYNIYRQRGDIESANGCYAEMKSLFTERYKYLYLEDQSLNNWFRWRLNQLLKVYTEHGTDPAKALVMSFYIVLIFAFIYLFFPSEWDIHSKSKIFRNIKDALEKDKKGTFKSILLSLYHLFIMVLNAFTLSLNSFTTLGFGNIPTKGLARYLTIIQGFVGWFLLGLFSVSLINQVLA